MRVLVLSHSYQPINHVGWQKAITWVLSGRADVVEEYSERVIHTTDKVFPMPAVIRFAHKHNGDFRKQAVRFSRRNIWLRDKGRCQYCGKAVGAAEFTLDHIIPKSKGGLTKWQNIVTACKNCNHKKGDRLMSQLGYRLQETPTVPKGIPMLLSVNSENIPDSWKVYLGS
jgi:5-methylcytosine-specific restriction endonuclease McrA